MEKEALVTEIRKWYAGGMTDKEGIAFFQELVNSGLIAYMSNDLQRVALDGIEDGYLVKSEASGGVFGCAW